MNERPKMSGPNLESSCPYEILGVDKNATLKHIKLAYRKLALQHHPDKLPPNASESERNAAHSKFAAISNSYEILSDDGRRREHDYESSMQRDNSSRHSQQQQQQYQYQQQQRGHHDDFFGGGMFGGGSLFDDPFFASPFGRRQRGSGSHNVQFTDPFEMFERFFQEELGHNRTNNGRSGSRSSSQRMDPFSDPFFSSMGGTGFFGNASQMSASHFGMANSLMSQMSMQQQQFGSGNSGGHSSYSFTSSSSSGFGGGQSVSTSTRTTVVNGVKQTVTERTVRHPDGRVERFIDSSGGDSGRIASANYPALESEGRRRHR